MIGCTFLMMEIASDERNLGYRTSSLTIESKTSSSSSPGKGDCRGQSANNDNIINIDHVALYANKPSSGMLCHKFFYFKLMGKLTSPTSIS